MSSSNAQASANKWVTVSWMPHTSLAPTSHVTLAIRSAHACLADPRFSCPSSSLHSPRAAEPTTGDDETNVCYSSERSRDWKVRISVHGFGGVELVPIDCRTPSAPLTKRSSDGREWFFRPTVSQATHDCRWDFVAKLPLRWRDLPRDAYLLFRVVQDDGAVVRKDCVWNRSCLIRCTISSSPGLRGLPAPL